MKTLRLTPPEPSEAELQAALMRRLQLRGWLAVRINGGSFKRGKSFFRAYIIQGLDAYSGFPDVLALKAGGFRLFELKASGGVRSEAQVRFAKFALRHGVEVEVVEGLDGLEALKL